jgi:hypothetical protein
MIDRMHVTRAKVRPVCAHKGCDESTTHVVVFQACGPEDADTKTYGVSVCDDHVDEAFVAGKVDADAAFPTQKPTALPT